MKYSRSTRARIARERLALGSVQRMADVSDGGLGAPAVSPAKPVPVGVGAYPPTAATDSNHGAAPDDGTTVHMITEAKNGEAKIVCTGQWIAMPTASKTVMRSYTAKGAEKQLPTGWESKITCAACKRALSGRRNGSLCKFGREHTWGKRKFSGMTRCYVSVCTTCSLIKKVD